MRANEIRKTAELAIN